MSSGFGLRVSIFKIRSELITRNTKHETRKGVFLKMRSDVDEMIGTRNQQISNFDESLKVEEVGTVWGKSATASRASHG